MKELSKNKKKTLDSNPPKGTSDWLPKEFSVRKYIFDTWREVCTRFGYEEYLTPIVERAEVYRAKSGEDIGGKELMTMTDKAGRELAIRPEMTPSVTRMVSTYYESAPKPIKLFSIANFVRNEKPQRGRNREFWQLNYDVFGTNSIEADIEVIQIGIEIILGLNAPKDSFVVYLSNRKLVDYLLDEILKLGEDTKLAVVRVMDKYFKLRADEFGATLEGLGVTKDQVTDIVTFLKADNLEELVSAFPGIEESIGVKETRSVIDSLDVLGYGEYIELKTSIIRGFDYYDGIIFEVFDKNPENNRAMFGGGRYNGLGKIYGIDDLPAVGAAPGDETLKLFLESWDLIDSLNVNQERYYLPLIDDSVVEQVKMLAQSLRKQGKNVILGLELERLGKSLQYANSKGISKVIIFGSQEKDRGLYIVKDMETGEQEELNIGD